MADMLAAGALPNSGCSVPPAAVAGPFARTPARVHGTATHCAVHPIASAEIMGGGPSQEKRPTFASLLELEEIDATIFRGWTHARGSDAHLPAVRSPSGPWSLLGGPPATRLGAFAAQYFYDRATRRRRYIYLVDRLRDGGSFNPPAASDGSVRRRDDFIASGHRSSQPARRPKSHQRQMPVVAAPRRGTRTYKAAEEAGVGGRQGRVKDAVSFLELARARPGRRALPISTCRAARRRHRAA